MLIQGNMKFNYSKLSALLVLTLVVACVPVKQLSYFNDINEIQEPVVNPQNPENYHAF